MILVLVAIAALTALTMFAPLAAMFVFPRSSVLGRFLGAVSAFGVLLGMRCLIYWLRQRFV